MKNIDNNKDKEVIDYLSVFKVKSINEILEWKTHLLKKDIIDIVQRNPDKLSIRNNNKIYFKDTEINPKQLILDLPTKKRLVNEPLEVSIDKNVLTYEEVLNIIDNYNNQQKIKYQNLNNSFENEVTSIKTSLLKKYILKDYNISDDKYPNCYEMVDRHKKLLLGYCLIVENLTEEEYIEIGQLFIDERLFIYLTKADTLSFLDNHFPAEDFWIKPSLSKVQLNLPKYNLIENQVDLLQLVERK